MGEVQPFHLSLVVGKNVLLIPISRIASPVLIDVFFCICKSHFHRVNRGMDGSGAGRAGQGTGGAAGPGPLGVVGRDIVYVCFEMDLG